ncbi:GNAT family N-acetyltransferase [Paenibacillus sp. PR3]|uniref:GNAT family N-acetyltransferase n=1 Tax=Paenibacillus terricola TaxID=2763503 RepID=A0ABR8MWU0_9BACL|nr:GNAT family N-acetyltransferase [Paenibacillus terricola]MBD3918619.1 GNAT family N-acetyltransferase [Paenibacillus terricola]
MLDRSLKWYRVILKRAAGTAVPQVELPSGYSFVHYQTGDEEAWADIEASVLEFDSQDEAMVYFTTRYLPFQDELMRRTLFIQAANGEKVATFTAWWNYTDKRRHPFVHAVAVKPQHQGVGLGKALIAAGIKHMIELEGDCVMYIPTSTWAYRAIKLYRSAGFEFEWEEPVPGGFVNQTTQAIEVLKGRLSFWE